MYASCNSCNVRLGRPLFIKTPYATSFSRLPLSTTMKPIWAINGFHMGMGVAQFYSLLASVGILYCTLIIFEIPYTASFTLEVVLCWQLTADIAGMSSKPGDDLSSSSSKSLLLPI